MLAFYENWKNNEGKEILSKWVLDPERLLYSENGDVEGTYAIDVMECATEIVIKAYVGEIGHIQRAKKYVASTIKERLLQHLKSWLGNGYVEYWTGVSEEELNKGKYKFRLSLLQKECDVKKRKRLEEQYILKTHPYLQYGPYRKYPSNYDGLDLCIIPWRGTRRAAFLARVNELFPKYDASRYVQSTSWDKDWEEVAKQDKPSQELVTMIENQIPMYSDIHVKAKKQIDCFLNVPAYKRGCNYKYIVSLFAKAYVMERESVGELGRMR